MKKYISIIIALFTSTILFAQDNIEMADKMRAEGKIYVVVAVMAVILIGLFIYLFTIDRKLSRLEKEINKN